MIAPQGPHKRTAEAMRQDSAEITPEQIEGARKLVAKYPNLTQRPQPNVPQSLAIGVVMLLISITAGVAITALMITISYYAAPWLH